MLSSKQPQYGITDLLDNKKLTEEERKKILIVSEALSLVYYNVKNSPETTIIKEMENLEKYVEILNRVLK